jgi:AraC-like DNA-binding protein
VAASDRSVIPDLDISVYISGRANQHFWTSSRFAHMDTPAHPASWPPNGAVEGAFGSDPNLWRQRIGGLVRLPARLREFGVDVERLLNDLELDPHLFESADATIRYRDAGRLLHAAAERSGYPTLALMQGQDWSLADAGLVGALALNSPTIGAALESLAVHHHLNGQGGCIFVRRRGDTAEFGYAIYIQDVPHVEDLYDVVVSVGCNWLAELCGRGWEPTEVLLARPQPRDPGPYRRRFRTRVLFGSEVCAVRFPAHWLARRIEGANPKERLRLERLARNSDRVDLVEKLRRSLRIALISGVSSGDALAGLLAMNHRTLNRRLHAQGVSFRDILEEVRYDVARHLLTTSALPIDDIAAALSYASASPFVRSFKRWSGQSPGQWRREHPTAPSIAR